MQLVDRCDMFLLFSEFFLFFFTCEVKVLEPVLGWVNRLVAFMMGRIFLSLVGICVGKICFGGRSFPCQLAAVLAANQVALSAVQCEFWNVKSRLPSSICFPFFLQMMAALNIEHESEPKQSPSRNVPAVNKRL